MLIKHVSLRVNACSISPNEVHGWERCGYNVKTPSFILFLIIVAQLHHKQEATGSNP